MRDNEDAIVQPLKMTPSTTTRCPTEVVGDHRIAPSDVLRLAEHSSHAWRQIATLRDVDRIDLERPVGRLG